MPESRRLIPKRVWITAVVAPATVPATQATAVATRGSTCAVRSMAATAAPKVMEPSPVISGKSNTRKLTNTPSARSDRIAPIVKAPITNDISVRLPPGDRASPACAADELALPDPDYFASVVEQVEYAEEVLGLEQVRHRVPEIDAAMLQGAEREGRRVKMTEEPG